MYFLEMALKTSISLFIVSFSLKNCLCFQALPPLGSEKLLYCLFSRQPKGSPFKFCFGVNSRTWFDGRVRFLSARNFYFIFLGVEGAA